MSNNTSIDHNSINQLFSGAVPVKGAEPVAEPETVSDAEPTVEADPMERHIDGAREAEKTQEERNEAKAELFSKDIPIKGAKPKVEEDTGLSQEQNDKTIEYIVGQIGEDFYDIPPEAVIQHKVDGKPVKVSIKEMMRDYSGTKAFKQRFDALNREKQIIATREQKKSAKISEIFELAKENPYAALEELAVYSGHDADEFLPSYLAQAEKTVEDLNGLTEQEKSFILQKKRLDAKERRINSEKEQKEAEEKAVAEDTEFETYKTELFEKHKFTAEELEEVVGNLEKISEKENIDITKIPKKELASFVADRVLKDVRPQRLIGNLVKEMAPNYEGKESLTSDLADMLKAGQITAVSDIVELIKGVTTEEVASGKQTVSTTKRAAKPKTSKTSVKKSESEDDGGLRPLNEIFGVSNIPTKG